MANKLGLRPLGINVVVKRSEAKTMTDGGIALPENTTQPPKKGTVMAVGPGLLRDDGLHDIPTVQEGDVILFEPYSFTEVEVDGKEYIIMPEDKIIAVIQ